jgi:hypothetical protein
MMLFTQEVYLKMKTTTLPLSIVIMTSTTTPIEIALEICKKNNATLELLTTEE